jgi:hypothetical protein
LSVEGRPQLLQKLICLLSRVKKRHFANEAYYFTPYHHCADLLLPATTSTVIPAYLSFVTTDRSESNGRTKGVAVQFVETSAVLVLVPDTSHSTRVVSTRALCSPTSNPSSAPFYGAGWEAWRKRWQAA